jgi:PAS domain S-box-containing protein
MNKEIATLVHSQDTIIDKNATLFDAQKLILQNKSAVVIVDDKKPVGVLTRRDMLALLNDEVDFCAKAFEYAKIDVIHAGHKRTIEYALHLMVNYDIRRLVIVDDEGAYLGIVTQDDLMFELNEQAYYTELRAVHLLGSQSDLICFDIDGMARDALSQMVSKKADSGIVIDSSKKPVGIITESTLLAISVENLRTVCLKDIMSSPLECITMGTHLGRIVDEMRAANFGHLAVIDNDGFAIGVIDAKAILRNIEGSFGHFLQKKLKSTREALNTLSQIVLEAVIINGEYRIQWANEKAKVVFGIGLVDKKLDEIIGKEHWSSIGCGIHTQPLVADIGGRYFEISALTSDEDRFQISLNDITRIINLQKELEQKEFEQKSIAMALEEGRKVLAAERNLFVGGPVAVFKWSGKDGWPIEYVSPNVGHILGASAESLMGQSILFTQLIHPDDLARVIDEVLGYMATKTKSFDQEYRLIRSNGEYGWFHDYTVIEYNNDGQAEYINGYLIDVTDKKITEKELMYVKESLDRGQNVAHLGSWDLSLETNTLWWSDEIYRIFGLKPQEFAATYEAFMSYVHPDDLTKVETAIKQSIEDKKTYEVVHRIVLKNGEEKTVREKGETLFDANKNAVRMVGVVHDITEQVKAEEGLRLREKQLAAVVENLPVGVFFATPNEGVVLSNRAGNEIWGDLHSVKKEEFGEYKAWFYGTDKMLEAEDWGAYRSLVGGETVINQKLTVEPFSGKQKIIFESSVPILADDGAITGAIVINEDITDRNAYENELRVAKEEAEKANRAKSEFLANMSHEIRTPMNAVLGFAELLKSEELDSASKGFVDGIILSGRNLLGLINDILDLSKIEAGKMGVAPEPTDLQKILRELKIIFEMKAKDKGLLYELIIENDFPHALLIDETRVKQILFNLLGNAVKFTEKGSIRLIASSKKSQISPEHIDIVLSIEDTGIGVPSEQIQSIFEAFQQTDGQSTRKYGGTGLGLAISKKLADIMGATLEVSSILNGGSVFTLTLKDVAHSTLGEVLEDGESDDIRLSGGKVLLIEDISTNRAVVKGFLSAHGVEVFEAENGKIGVDMARVYRPDVILMDMQMPIMDGHEATKILKNDPDTAGIAIVALTASAMNSKKDETRELCDGYLQKPISSKILISQLAKFLPHTIKESDAANGVVGEKFSHDEKKIISVRLKEEWMRANRLKSNDEIEEFARLVKKTAKELKSESLRAYADSLIEACEGFKIIQINKLFEQFETMIEV